MYRFWSIALLLTSVSAHAVTPDECFDLLARAETEKVMDINPYEACDFDNAEVAWEVWAPYASQNNMKRALFELCERYPSHIYHSIYCEKSATLGYGPALAFKAEKLLKKGEGEAGLRWAEMAIETDELSEKQIANLLEIIGIYYLENNNQKFQEYLEQAAIRRSALANHILGAMAFSAENLTEKTKKEAFMYIWRAILLGCTHAQENLGLFHLARQNKLPLETVQQMMKDKMMTCEPDIAAAVKPIDEREMYGCQCKTALANDKRIKEKPYLLLKIDGDTAFLVDHTGQKYTVSANDNLPNQGSVAEVRKTAVILTYPQNRVILNLYKEDKCVSFCQKYNITQNLSAAQMQKKIMGGEDIILKPYRLSFNETECETLKYYAKQLVDISLPYVGKEECAQDVVSQNDEILSHIQAEDPMQMEQTAEPSDKKEMSEETKKRLKSFGSELLGI